MRCLEHRRWVDVPAQRRPLVLRKIARAGGRHRLGRVVVLRESERTKLRRSKAAANRKHNRHGNRLAPALGSVPTRTLTHARNIRLRSFPLTIASCAGNRACKLVARADDCDTSTVITSAHRALLGAHIMAPSYR